MQRNFSCSLEEIVNHLPHDLQKKVKSILSFQKKNGIMTTLLTIAEQLSKPERKKLFQTNDGIIFEKTLRESLHNSAIHCSWISEIMQTLPRDDCGIISTTSLKKINKCFKFAGIIKIEIQSDFSIYVPNDSNQRQEFIPAIEHEQTVPEPKMPFANIHERLQALKQQR